MCTLTARLTLQHLKKKTYNIEEYSNNIELLSRRPLWIKFILSNYNMWYLALAG